MSDSPESRVERDTSQTASPTPKGFQLTRRNFLLALGGGGAVAMTQISCSPSGVGIVTNAALQAQAAETVPPVKLPEGALKLAFTTDDGTPVGVMRREGRILFCIGEDECELRRFSQGANSLSLDDTFTEGMTPRNAIKNVGLNKDDALVVESDFGSLLIDVPSQKMVAEELRSKILWMRQQGVQESTVIVNDVAYTLELNGAGTLAYVVAKAAGANTPPLRDGTCSVTISVLPKEPEQPESVR